MKDPILGRLERDNSLIIAEGGLHYIKGNSSPYFSLTGQTYEKIRNGRWREDCSGCIHDILLKAFPHLADLAALHMSDIDGAPMYALENGFYYLGGTHWQKPNYEHAAVHFRISEDEARALVRDLFGPANEAKARLDAWVDTQRPRWKAEADACIAKHGLVVYGDPWEQAA